MPILIALAISALVGGGVSVAANNSLPGDTLYGVKVGINEPVREFFAFSAKAKAQTETDIAITRAQEMEKLSARGKVSSSAAADLETSFRNHVNEAGKFIAELNPSSSIEASSNFRSSLNAHGILMRKLAREEADDKDALLSFSLRINEADDETANTEADAEVKMKTESQTDNESSAQGKLTAALNKIAEVKSYIKAKSPLAADVQAGVDAKLLTADTDIANGKIALDAKSYADAFILFQKAQFEARLAKEYVQSGLELHIGIEGKNDEAETKVENGMEIESGEPAKEDDSNESSGASVKIENKTNGQISPKNGETESDTRVKIGL